MGIKGNRNREILDPDEKTENLTTASLLPSGAQLAHVRESSPL